ncbi:MAG: ABC transporter ATP-binding protein [Opitutaceae bacterium]|nr:ABC transporter ATP-binding protein [Opitutaceae bacterium]
MSVEDEPPAVLLRGLGKDHASGWRGGVVRALDRLDMRIDRGQVYGLLGANGSGKSTTLKLIMGLQSPTRGTCEVLGGTPACPAIRRRMGFLPESPGFYRHLTGSEMVTICGRLSGLQGVELRGRVAAVLELVGLAEAGKLRIGTYSRGMVQRIGLAQALVHDPELLVCDEPTAGIDPVGVVQMMEVIARLKASGKTVLLTSHLLTEVVEVCDRVAILQQGRLIAEGELAGLMADRQPEVIVRGLGEKDEQDLREWLLPRGGIVEPAGMTGRQLQHLFRSKTGEH